MVFAKAFLTRARRSLALSSAVLLIVSALDLSPSYGAESVLAAVATNFAQPFEEIAASFAKETGHEVRMATGSSGKFFAQIVHGAPYDVFLSADRERPARLIELSHAVKGSQFTYAEGRLVLWSRSKAHHGSAWRDVLRKGDFRKLAIANPEVAPYGKAAQEVLIAIGAHDLLRPKIVLGENIGQAFAMVATGNAEWGLIAASSLAARDDADYGTSLPIRAQNHSAIRQDAVLLTRSAEIEAAIALIAYLRSEAAKTIIRRYGYGTTE